MHNFIIKDTEKNKTMHRISGSGVAAPSVASISIQHHCSPIRPPLEGSMQIAAVFERLVGQDEKGDLE